MTARDGRVSKPPSRQRPSRAKKKGLARRERETKRVTSNGAARSTASFYQARRILLALVALFPFQRAINVVKTNSGKLYPEREVYNIKMLDNSIDITLSFCFILKISAFDILE